MRTFRSRISQDTRASEGRTIRRSSSAGFTLIELLMVITIIGILLGMLIPAVAGVITAARIAEARTEISGLETSLTEFKTKYGVYPPSRIRLSETAAGWDIDTTNDSPALQTLKAASISSIREIFGTSFDFSIARDINGDTDMTDTLVLTGAECLVFFLGGVSEIIANTSDPVFVKIGFSNNPADPFSRAGQSRVGPFFEFDIGRFTNLRIPTNFMPEYRDPLPDQINPYWFVSTAATGQYEIADLAGSGMDNVYSSNATTDYKRKSYQIISPGFDTLYGTGGIFDPNGNSGNLTIDDEDNLTNFHSGKLGN